MSSQSKIVTRVLGEELEKFEADNIMLKRTDVKRMGGTQGHRSEFTEWFDAPIISTTTEGLTISSFNETTSLSVPHRVSTFVNSEFKLTNSDTLDGVELARKMRSAMQAIDNKINRMVGNNILTQGAQFVPRSSALSGFADVAAIDTLLVSQDVSQISPKTLILNPGDSNAMAADLAGRGTVRKGDITTTAYERAKITEIADFMVFKSSFLPQKVGRALTTTTVTGAQTYIPVGSTLDANGDPTNVDNRVMNLLVGTTAAVVPGDKFTIAGVNAVSLQNKEDTGELRTFTVVNVVDGTNLTISPPIIDSSVTATNTATQAQKDYGNVTAEAAGGATLTFINLATAKSNLFWVNDAISINVAPVVGSENDLGGIILMNATTELGMNVVVAKQGAISDLSTQWRVTTFVGVTIRDPLMCGMMLGAQV